MSEGLQILLLGILFQILHHKNKVLDKESNFIIIFGG